MAAHAHDPAQFHGRNMCPVDRDTHIRFFWTSLLHPALSSRERRRTWLSCQTIYLRRVPAKQVSNRDPETSKHVESTSWEIIRAKGIQGHCRPSRRIDHKSRVSLWIIVLVYWSSQHGIREQCRLAVEDWPKVWHGTTLVGYHSSDVCGFSMDGLELSG